ncbi:ankyrin, partial [Melanomma pulvis-pyrius CBS 109.77]
TALHYAASHGSTKCAQDLFKYRPAIDSADCTGRTPLIIAAKNGHNDLVELLLKCGADHTLRDSSGRTAL